MVDPHGNLAPLIYQLVAALIEMCDEVRQGG